jgi:hypothetical protein
MAANPISYLPTGLRSARSPIFLSFGMEDPSDILSQVFITLYIYTGSSASTPASSDYTITKNAINNQVVVEISDLIREILEPSFSKDDITTISQSTLGEAVWCKVAVAASWYAGGVTYTFDDLVYAHNFLVTDGYDDYTEQATSNVAEYRYLTSLSTPYSTNTSVTSRLIADRTFQVYESFSQSLPIYYDDLANVVGVEYEINGGSYYYEISDFISGGYTSTQSTRKIVYIPFGVPNIASFVGVTPTGSYVIKVVGANEFEEYVERVAAGGGVLEAETCLTDAILALGGTIYDSYNVDIICEPKYTPVQVSFINKEGVMDSITFFKRSNRNGNFTNEAYMPQISPDAVTDIDLTKPQFKQFLVNSTETLTLNTGWVEEAYDEVIRQLLLSERVIIYDNGNKIAANPQRGGVTYQKEVNDKTINYTLSFDIAYNKLNNIR